MYTVLGPDQQEYGPVSAEQLRQWIADGRVTGTSLIRKDGEREPRPLNSFSEFAVATVSAALHRPPPLPEPAAPKTSRLALTSLILSLFGLCLLPAVASVVCGALALRRIRRSGGQLRGRGLAIAGLSVSVATVLIGVPVLTAMLLPGFKKVQGETQRFHCFFQLQQLGRHVREYAADHKDVFPPAETWCDAIMYLIRTNRAYLCPAQTTGDCGYAYNQKLSNLRETAIDPRTVMLFESDAGWNRSGGPELMLTTPRHSMGIFVVFANGNVQPISTQRVSELRWDP